jgi:hypothetical protein
MGVLGWKPHFRLPRLPDDRERNEQRPRIRDDVPRWKMLERNPVGRSESVDEVLPLLRC